VYNFRIKSGIGKWSIDIDDTKGINNLVLILVLILGTVPKMIDTKTKIEFLAELSLLLFDIRLDVDQILNKYISLY
jgi:hypothetical protein